MLERIDPIWLSLGPLLAINVFFLATFGLFVLNHRRSPPHEDTGRKDFSRFLSRFFVNYWYWVLTPLERTLVKWKVSPDSLTIGGLLLSGVAAFFFHKGMVGAGGWFMILGATFDLLDGRIARLTGRESRSGAFFDSVVDRFSEGIVFLGLASWYRDSWILYFVLIAFIGSMMVSYTRARGEGMGIKVTKGIMQRPERIAYLGVSSIFSPILAYFVSLAYYVPIDFLTILSLILISILTNLGAIYRIQYVLIQLDPAPQEKRLFRRFVQKWIS